MPKRLDRVMSDLKRMIAALQALKRDIRGIQKRAANVDKRVEQIYSIQDALADVIKNDYDVSRIKDHVKYTDWFRDTFDRINPDLDALIKRINEAIEDFKNQWKNYEAKVGLETWFPDEWVYEETEPSEGGLAQEKVETEQLTQEMPNKIKKKESSLKEVIKELIKKVEGGESE